MNTAEYIITIETKAKKELEEIKEFIKICEVCREFYNIEPEYFYNRTKSRMRDVVDCRALAIYFGYNYFMSMGKLAWSRIANVFNMNHSSMIHNKNKVESLLRFDKPTKLAVAEIRKQIENA